MLPDSYLRVGRELAHEGVSSASELAAHDAGFGEFTHAAAIILYQSSGPHHNPMRNRMAIASLRLDSSSPLSNLTTI